MDNNFLLQHQFLINYSCIDLDRLDTIRQEAALTREKLMTEEERREEALPSLEEGPDAPLWGKAPDLPATSLKGAASRQASGEPPSGQAGQGPAVGQGPADPAQTDRPWGLTEDEYHYLQDLLYGGDTSWAPAKGLMLSLLPDGINEKCYGEFGDTVLEDAEGPEVIPDYAEELKGKFQL